VQSKKKKAANPGVFASKKHLKFFFIRAFLEIFFSFSFFTFFFSSFLGVWEALKIGAHRRRTKHVVYFYQTCGVLLPNMWCTNTNMQNVCVWLKILIFGKKTERYG